jgi:hypothetical protein
MSIQCSDDFIDFLRSLRLFSLDRQKSTDKEEGKGYTQHIHEQIVKFLYLIKNLPNLDILKGKRRLRKLIKFFTAIHHLISQFEQDGSRLRTSLLLENMKNQNMEVDDEPIQNLFIHEVLAFIFQEEINGCTP